MASLWGYCPLDKKDWRDVKKDGGAETILLCVQVFQCNTEQKQSYISYYKYNGDLADYIYPLFLKIQTKFLYPAKCDKWILKTIGRDWRKFKAGLKKDFFNAKKKRKALYKLCPEYVDSDQWRGLVKYWKSKEGRVSFLPFLLHCVLMISTTLM